LSAKLQFKNAPYAQGRYRAKRNIPIE